MKDKYYNENKCVIGTWGWGNGYNGSGMIFGNTPKKSEIANSFHSAIGSGLLIFDTAPVYGGGQSEKLLGKLSADNPEIIISTKYFPVQNPRISNVKKSFQKSLLRLEREYVDILWLHQPVNIEYNMKAMAELVLDGRVKHIGISNADISDIWLAQNVLSRYNLKLYGV